jgi:hypothetical protein
MIDLVVAKAKTGAWKNVIPFGMPLPAAPYIVVKEEPTPFGYVRWRFIGHSLPSQMMQLRSYMKKDIVNLIDGQPISGTGLDDRYLILDAMPNGTVGVLSVVSDDGTISLECIFQQFNAP